MSQSRTFPPRRLRPRLEVLEDRLALSATVLVVDTFEDVIDANDDVRSLREAIIEANSNAGDYEIQLQAGTYHLTLAGADEEGALTGDLDVLDNGAIRIVGAGADATIVHAGGDVDFSIPAVGDRVFHVHFGADLTIDNARVTGGAVTGTMNVFGGGILVASGNLHLNRVWMDNNSAEGDFGEMAGTSASGGAIQNSNGIVTINNSLLSGNSARGGSSAQSGGIAFGGAIQNTGMLTIRNSTLSGNLAQGGASTNIGGIAIGGAIVGMGGTTILLHSTIVENSALAGSATNPGLSLGGGLFDSSGTFQVGHSLIALNTTSSETDPDVSGTFSSLDYNLIGLSQDNGLNGFTPANDLVGTDLDPIDPILGPLADNGGPTQTHALLTDSPALDAGDPDFDPDAFDPALSNDQRGAGFDRVANSRIDIGAFEAQIDLVLDPIADRTLVLDDFDFITVTFTAHPSFPLDFSVEVEALDTVLFELDQELGLTRFPDADGYRENLHGGDEKWLFSASETGPFPWYFLTPAGTLHRYQGEANPLDGAQIAALDPLVWQDPRLLHEAAIPPDVLHARLLALDQELGLEVFPDDEDYRFNIHGGGEIWFFSTNETGPFPWYFLTPEGNLHHYQGELNPLDGIEVARLTSEVWFDPALLDQADSADPPLPEAILEAEIDSSGELSLFAFGTLGGLFRVTVTVEDGNGSDSTSFLVGMVNTPPTVEPIDDRTEPSDLSAIFVPVTDFDPEVPPQDLCGCVEVRAYQLLYQVDQALDLIQFPDADGYRENLHGGNEKWLFSESETGLFPWYFLTPEGNLHHYQGEANPLDAAKVATLTPLAWEDPTLLHDAAFPTEPTDVFAFNDGHGQIIIINIDGYQGLVEFTVLGDDFFAAVAQSFVVNFVAAT